MVLKLQGGIGHVAEGVEHSEVIGRINVERLSQSFVAVFLDGIEDLQRGEHQTGAVYGADVDVAKLAKEVGGEFGLGFCLFDVLAVFEVVLLAALEPLGEALVSDAAARFGQFVDDDFVGEAVFEHEVGYCLSVLSPFSIPRPRRKLTITTLANASTGGETDYCP